MEEVAVTGIKHDSWLVTLHVSIKDCTVVSELSTNDEPRGVQPPVAKVTRQSVIANLEDCDAVALSDLDLVRDSKVVQNRYTTLLA